MLLLLCVVGHLAERAGFEPRLRMCRFKLGFCHLGRCMKLRLTPRLRLPQNPCLIVCLTNARVVAADSRRADSAILFLVEAVFVLRYA